MAFHCMDIDKWGRREYFKHYFQDSPCTWSMTVNLDVRRIIGQTKESGRRFFPVLLYCIAAVVNRHEEFRMGMDSQNRVGYYDVSHPSYTIFHSDTNTFSSIWTRYDCDFPSFYAQCAEDMETYENAVGFEPKPDMPPNVFSVSCVPWCSFTGFHLNVQRGYTYLAPIFTIGKYFEENGRTLLPFALQVHHAVCDGFHGARFAADLQELLDTLQLAP